MDENNIDKLFQEKLKDFKAVPDENVWGKISHSLDKQRPKRRVLPIWWAGVGAAALLVLAFLLFNPLGTSDPAGTEVSGTDQVAPEADVQETIPGGEEADHQKDEVFITPNSQSITKTKDEVNKGGDDPFMSAKEYTDRSKNNVVNGEVVSSDAVPSNEALDNNGVAEVEESGVNVPDPVQSEQISGIALESSGDAKATELKGEDVIDGQINSEEIVAVEEKSEPENAEENASPEFKERSIFEALEEEDSEMADTKGKKWSVGPSVAPVYFDALGSGSSIDAQFSGNNKSGEVTMSYGLNIGYKLTGKWEIRTGVHRVDFSHRTEDIAFGSSFNTSGGGGLANIDYVPTSTNLVVQSQVARANPDELALANDVAAQNPSRDGRMIQEIGYMEIPLEVSYQLMDRKLGLRLIGGMSSLFLLDNNVTLESQGNTMQVGEANNINSLNFSTNLGLGLSYRATEKVQLNVEPVVKYQLNTFSNVSGNFRPYTLGIYSGLIYKF